jgi:hypothetical protein
MVFVAPASRRSARGTKWLINPRNVIDEIHAEMRGVRDELTRLRISTLDHFDPQPDPEKPR